MLSSFNAFEAGLIITHDNDEDPKHTHFLDIDLDISRDVLDHAVYRKPLNTYNYTPANSCHARQTFDGIVATELNRLSRICKCKTRYDAEVLFFFDKLHQRGYDINKCFEILSQLSPAVAAPSDRVLVPFKFPYSPNAHKLRTSFFWNKHVHLLPESLRRRMRFIHCNTASPNLFRLRYARFNHCRGLDLFQAG